ncbi:MAG: HAMP domain-containing sensor histidine kinase [Fulvivirga sp.]|uniref:HAMP domain-containing sensor histidine kinase n=1 Tax=Fulvivirga sp. TaxID=1931237 RepID=UPI0032EC906B
MQRKSYKTELSERAKELEDRNEELQAQHEELTAAVEAMISKNDRLEKTLEELNIRNKEIDQIVYRSYHDLKTPITALEGLLSLIEFDSEGRDIYIAKSKASIVDMKHLLKMLARYSSSLVDVVKSEKLNFVNIWEEVLNDLGRYNGIDEVKLTFSQSSEKVFGDTDRIKLLLYNVVKNAIDFRSEKGRVDVSIGVKQNNLKIQVTDNGLGIPSEVQSNVFDMFYRGSTKSKGSGLGLYLCKRTVEILNGKISLVSSVNIGTTVTMELPIKKVEEN